MKNGNGTVGLNPRPRHALRLGLLFVAFGLVPAWAHLLGSHPTLPEIGLAAAWSAITASGLALALRNPTEHPAAQTPPGE